MNSIPPEMLSEEKGEPEWTKVNHVQTLNRMNRDEPCTDMYVLCTYKDEQCTDMYIQCTNMYIQIEMHVSLFILCSDQTLFIQCTYQVHTLNVQVQVCMYT
jgi:hypothetical protein